MTSILEKGGAGSELILRQLFVRLGERTCLRERGIFVKPLGDTGPVPGYMRVATALPEDNARVLEAPRRLL